MDLKELTSLIAPFTSKKCWWAYFIQMSGKKIKNFHMVKSWRNLAERKRNFHISGSIIDGKPVVVAILDRRVPTRKLAYLAGRKSVEKILEVGINVDNINPRPPIPKVETISVVTS